MEVNYDGNVQIVVTCATLLFISREIVKSRGEEIMSEKHQDLSRRQFLNYTLTGVGGFMAAAMLTPMVRFAIDPMLRVDAAGADMIPTLPISEFGPEPREVHFTVKIQDGWYPYEKDTTAWVTYDAEKDEFLVLDPTCKHLGCLIQWDTNPNYAGQYYCPCHDGRYYKDGVNVPNTPPKKPLNTHSYEVRELNGEKVLYVSAWSKERGA